MVTDRGSGWSGPGDDDVPAVEPDGDGYGPPSELEDAWFTQFVASRGYPRPGRDPIQFNGQLDIYQYLENEEAEDR